MAFAGWFVQRLPTGFIPSLDRAILIISLQLPPGASLARTDAVVQRATDLVLATPGVKYSNAFTGRNGATFTFATNAGLLFLVLDDFEERHRLGQTIDKIAQDVRGKLAQIEEAQAFVFIPPPVRGMGAAAGFSMRLQDTLGMRPDRVRPHHAGVRRRGQPHAGHRQRVHHLPGLHPAGLRRRRSRQGADAARCR